jgi:arylsulfatase A-like enzyme
VPPGNNGSTTDFEEYLFAQRAVHLIKTHVNPSVVPFFLNYDLHIAHEPIEIPRPYFERQLVLQKQSGVGDFEHRRSTYQAMISFMDEAVGNITNALHVREMYENTIICYSSDK